jgi:hypothetical protein
MTTLSALIALVGTGLGIAYCFTGIKAASHLLRPDKNDKYFNWALWWCLDTVKYDELGQRYCRRGKVLAALAILSWGLFYWSNSPH